MKSPGALTTRDVVLLLCGCLLFNLFWSAFWPSGLILDLTLVVALYVGWHRSPPLGAFWGSLLGLMQDVASGSPYWGLYGLSKTLAGFAGFYLSRWVLLDSIPARMVLIAVVSLADTALVALLLGLIGHDLGPLLGSRVLVQAVVTGVAGGLVFRLLDQIKFPEKDFRRVEEG